MDLSLLEEKILQHFLRTRAPREALSHKTSLVKQTTFSRTKGGKGWVEIYTEMPLHPLDPYIERHAAPPLSIGP